MIRLLILLLASGSPEMAAGAQGDAGAAGGGASPEARSPGKLALETPAGARFRFGGLPGERIERNVTGWLLPAPEANPGMLEMFRMRDRKPEAQLVDWAGEFAGKYLISAIQALRETERPELERLVERLVRELVASQAEDGYLGPFPRRERLLAHWDLWGHYHVMQALLLWHERTGSAEPLEAVRRAADLIAATYLDTGRRVLDAGSPEMNMAVIHVLGTLYRLTGEARYLRLVKEIEKDWERAGDYFRQGLAGVDFYRTPRPRWESLHDLEGLVELYRITGDARYRTGFVNLWRSIARLDRHNTGGFSSGEQAVGHPYSPAAIETCCTIAWIALSADMLRLTGEPAAADELELATLNAVLGAQHPSGRWWTYSTPMDGAREASAHAIVFQSRAGTPELNCCSVNGPRGLGMLSEWSVLLAPDGPVVSYYGPMSARIKLLDGTALLLEEETAYPAGGDSVRLILHPEHAAEFTLRLRIPGWSFETEVTLPGGERRAAAPGSFLPVRRVWADGDAVTVRLDQRLRVQAGDRGLAGRISVFRGPLLLAYDPRWNPFDEDALSALDARALIRAQASPLPAPAGPLAPWILVRLPAEGGQTLTLSDFASAGATGTRYRSWLPAVHAPPPPVLLRSPHPGGAVSGERPLFTWDGRGGSRAVEDFTLVIAGSDGFSAPLLKLKCLSGRAVPETRLEPGRDYFWKVTARNPSGETESETRAFHVDPDLAPSPEGRFPPGPAPDGLLLAAPLAGSPEPARGLLLDAVGVERAAGPSGAPGSALAFDGEKGRVRYALPGFPLRDCTLAVRFSLRILPSGRIAQVASAWAGPLDDPLRLVIDGGRFFARIEAGGSFSTAGVPVAAGGWMHAAAVKSGGKLTLFIDGEEKTSVKVPEEIDSQAVSLGLGGNPNFTGNEFLACSLADLHLFARALSSEEVRRLAR